MPQEFALSNASAVGTLPTGSSTTTTVLGRTASRLAANFLPQERPHSRRETAGSYGEAVTRFDTLGVAEKYPSEFRNSWRDRREANCVRRFLVTLPRGSRVLDLPCGTGRLTPLLAERGLEITGADSSPRMVELARANWDRRNGTPSRASTARFEVEEGGATRFADGTFDAVVCNRLFHHFREPETRVAVLTEFRRICNGRMLVSFFNSFAVDAVRFRLKHALRGTTPTDRIPISMADLEADVAAAGLKILRTSAVVWGISPMWYVELCDAGKT